MFQLWDDEFGNDLRLRNARRDLQVAFGVACIAHAIEMQREYYLANSVSLENVTAIESTLAVVHNHVVSQNPCDPQFLARAEARLSDCFSNDEDPIADGWDNIVSATVCLLRLVAKNDDEFLAGAIAGDAYFAAAGPSVRHTIRSKKNFAPWDVREIESADLNCRKHLEFQRRNLERIGLGDMPTTPNFLRR